MKLLCIGDVVAPSGLDYLCNHLPKLKKDYSIDFTIVNGENVSMGNGIKPVDADTIFNYGADIITLGNHSFKQKSIYEYLDDNKYIIRPYNFYPSAPGNGYTIYNTLNSNICVISLIGRCFIEGASSNPFTDVDKLIKELEDQVDIFIIDFHAEATSEKESLAFFLDGRVSVIFGTHTHVQTADERILPNGTGYITDLGMCGPKNSVLGVDTQVAIYKQKTNMPTKFKPAEGPCELNGCIFEIDETTKKVIQVERIRI